MTSLKGRRSRNLLRFTWRKGESLGALRGGEGVWSQPFPCKTCEEGEKKEIIPPTHPLIAKQIGGEREEKATMIFFYLQEGEKGKKKEEGLFQQKTTCRRKKGEFRRLP